VSFGNGRIEEFYVACNCLSAEQMAEPDVARALAAAMAAFHYQSLLYLPPSEATEPQVWLCWYENCCAHVMRGLAATTAAFHHRSMLHLLPSKAAEPQVRRYQNLQS